MGSQIGPRLLFFFPLGNAFSLESEENFFFFSLVSKVCLKAFAESKSWPGALNHSCLQNSFQPKALAE